MLCKKPEVVEKQVIVPCRPEMAQEDVVPRALPFQTDAGITK